MIISPGQTPVNISLAIFALVLLAWLSCQIRRRLNNQEAGAGHNRAAHGPPAVLSNSLILGLDRLALILLANHDGWLNSLFTLYFNIVGGTLKHTFFGVTSYATIDPKNLNAVLRGDSWSVAPSRAALVPLLGVGIFTQDGPHWKLSRRALQSSLATKWFKDLEVFRAPVANLLKVLPREGNVDLQPFFRCLTLEFATAFISGNPMKCFGQLDTVDRHKFINAFSVAQMLALRRMRLFGLDRLLGNKQFQEACHTVHRFVDCLIEKHQKRENKDEKRPAWRCLLDALASQATSHEGLRGEVTNVLLAAGDTTASALSWTI